MLNPRVWPVRWATMHPAGTLTLRFVYVTRLLCATSFCVRYCAHPQAIQEPSGDTTSAALHRAGRTSRLCCVVGPHPPLPILMVQSRK